MSKLEERKLEPTTIPLSEETINILKSFKKQSNGKYKTEAQLVIASMIAAGTDPASMVQHLKKETEESLLKMKEKFFFKEISNTVSKKDAMKYSYGNSKSTNIFDVKTRVEIAHLHVNRGFSIEDIARHFGITEQKTYGYYREYKNSIDKYKCVPHGLRQIQRQSKG